MYMTVYDRWNTHVSDTCIQIQEVSKKKQNKIMLLPKQQKCAIDIIMYIKHLKVF